MNIVEYLERDDLIERMEARYDELTDGGLREVRVVASEMVAQAIRARVLPELRSDDHPLYWQGQPVIIIDSPLAVLGFLVIEAGSIDR